MVEELSDVVEERGVSDKVVVVVLPLEKNVVRLICG